MFKIYRFSWVNFAPIMLTSTDAGENRTVIVYIYSYRDCVTKKCRMWETLLDCLLGEPLGNYHKIDSIKPLNIYISAYQAIIRSHRNWLLTTF